MGEGEDETGLHQAQHLLKEKLLMREKNPLMETQQARRLTMRKSTLKSQSFLMHPQTQQAIQQ